MSKRLDRSEVERLLRRLPVMRPPETLWDRIEAARRSPEPVRAAPWLHRGVRPWLAAAAAVLALVGGTYAGVLWTYGAPSRWAVLPLAGTPAVGGTAMTGAGDLAHGEWLVTDNVSRAELSVGRIGVAEVGPNSRVRLDEGGLVEHRLTLARGSIHAVITAPPRLFLVETPAALATDLGCEYTLNVDDDGTSRIHVTAGWVEMKQGRDISLVPAGLVAEVQVGGRPGTPHPVDFPLDAQQSLRRLDAGTGTAADLERVVRALHAPSDFITLRQQSAITLWHLVQRLEPGLRERAYERLAALSPPPARVTREGILALERPMLERWRRELNPMWSEEAQVWWVRATRKMWELIVIR